MNLVRYRHDSNVANAHLGALDGEFLQLRASERQRVRGGDSLRGARTRHRGDPDQAQGLTSVRADNGSASLSVSACTFRAVSSSVSAWAIHFTWG